MPQKLPPDFLAKLKAITGKRPKTVIDHILKHGSITTEQLKNVYGYNHPPRAIRDVKEQGIPLDKFSVIGSDGRTIAAYRFADPTQARGASHAGRKQFPRAFKEGLLVRDKSKCGICLAIHEGRLLQIDHRVPYEVAGDAAGALDPEEFMLACGSCNRAKSWSCEHCQNWTKTRDPDICETCYWAHPEKYSHIAMQDIRRLDIVWTGGEVVDHDQILKLAESAGEPLPEHVKRVLRERVQNAGPKAKKRNSN